MKISFYTDALADNQEMEQRFGGLTADLAGLLQQNVQEFPFDLEGVTYSGTYEECLQFASDEMRKQSNVKAVIALMDEKGEENHFVERLFEITNCPIVGGGAARRSGNPGDGFIAQNDKNSPNGREQAAIFLITDDSVKITAEMCNIHDHIIGTCKLELLDARTIDKIDGVDAVTYLNELRASKGFSETDFEHLTLSTHDHINTHLNMTNGKICSGRDLEEEMIIRYVGASAAHDKIERFYTEAGDDSIIFGCAGLGSLLEKRFDCKCLGTFLYGEICYTGQRSVFGNLMLSRIRFQK